MAHLSDAEAGGAPVDDMDSAAAAIGNFFNDQPEQSQDVADGREEDPGELHGDEASSEDDPDGLDVSDEDAGSDEPDTPAIEAPASLKAEEKARFSQLPPEAQQFVTELEQRRNGQVQEATTRAAEAQRQAETRAAQADAMAKAQYAQQLQTFADALAPQMPDPQLAYSNPAEYVAQKAQYDAAEAQHRQLVQQVQALGQEAESTLSQAEAAERDRFLMSIPEVQNEASREAFFQKALGAAEVLGLDMRAIESATGPELKALREIADWREKAEKYDAAKQRFDQRRTNARMEHVRAGKTQRAQSASPNAAQPSSSQGRGLREATDRLKQTGRVEDAVLALRGLKF